MVAPNYEPLVLSLFFFIITITSSILVQAKFPPICSPSFCGNLTIRYPFYQRNSSIDHYCGYAGFGLECSNGRTIFHTQNDKYDVKSIDYDKKNLELVDIDLTGQTCPRARHNLTLKAGPDWSYDNTSSEHFWFFFNCTVPPLNPQPISCLVNDTNRTSYMFREQDIPKNWNGNCLEVVKIPVLKNSFENNGPSEKNFAHILQNGFQLEWSSIQKCVACEESHGYCGRHNTSKGYNNGEDFVCFCSNGKNSTDICPTGGFSSKIKMGVLCGAGAFVLASLLFLALHWYRIRHLQRSTSNAPNSLHFDTDPKKDLELCNSNYPTHVFSYKELEEATNYFDASNLLGDGGFGSVYYGKLRDGRSIAVKRLHMKDYKCFQQFMSEVQILSRLYHPNLVRLYGCTSQQSRGLLLVYEYVSNGTISDHLRGRCGSIPFPWSTRMNIAIQTADALSYLHTIEPQIIHRDIKTSNILLDDNFGVKVADFGLSRLIPLNETHASTSPQGTPGYLDPEYYKYYKLTDKSDVYSFGVVLIELISSKPAVDITRKMDEINLSKMAINKIQNNKLHELVDPNIGFESDCCVQKMVSMVAVLAVQCLQEEKEARPSMKDVLKALERISSGEFDTKSEENVGREGRLPTSTNLPSPQTVIQGWESTSDTSNASEYSRI